MTIENELQITNEYIQIIENINQYVHNTAYIQMFDFTKKTSIFN